MGASHSRVLTGIAAWGLVVVLGGMLCPLTIGQAETVSYEYDALGRLIEVERSDGTQTIYDLDPAGNRTQVREGATPNQPASITVPSSSTSGSYVISWTAPTSGTVDVYELYESTSSSFSSQTRIYSGTGQSKTVSGKGNGTYYYRVRACSVSCGGYRAGASGTKVTLPPAVPGGISLPATSETGIYTVGWGQSSSGTVTAYELYEATSSSFTGQKRVYNASGTSIKLPKRGDGTFYYRARACNGSACSGYTAAKSIVIKIRPSTPSSITVPSSSLTGSYTISWASSEHATTYELQEATTQTFSNATKIYSNSATSFPVTGRGNGNYWYRVRACNGSNNCSGMRNGSTFVKVTLPPSAPKTITVPATSNSGTYVVTWTAPPSGQFTRYELWEARNSSFSGATLVVNDDLTERYIYKTSEPSGTVFYYRVRACNGNACGSYRTASNPVLISRVVIPPPVKPSTLASALTNICSWRASWGASNGATYYTFLDASGQVSLTTSNRVVEYSFCGLPYYTGNSMDYRPKWVRACSSGGCSERTNF